MRIIVFITLLFAIIYGCNREFKNYKINDLFDYATISALDVDVILEIGETEEYIPGNIRDLVLLSDGSMVISDMQHTTVELFDESGNYFETIAIAGSGPGELNSFFNLKDTGSDTLIVRQLLSWRLDYFIRDKKSGNFNYVKSSTPETHERLFSVVGTHPGTGYYATSTFEGRNRQLPFIYETLVIIDESETIIQDSLGLLKTPNPVMDELPAGGLNIYGIPPYQYRDRFISMNDKGYLIAIPDSLALFLYDHENILIDRIDISMKERQIKSEDLEIVFKNREHDIRSRMEERIGNIKPPFINLWVSEEYILLHTDYAEKGREFLILEMNGTPAGKVFLSEHDDVRYFRNNQIYSIYKNPDIGHRIRIYEFKL